MNELISFPLFFAVCLPPASFGLLFSLSEDKSSLSNLLKNRQESDKLF